MTLRDRVIVVFAATGAIGSGTARELAAQGADLFVTGRDGARAEELAAALREAGGSVTAAKVDATDPDDVDRFLHRVVAERGRLDGAFNAIGLPPAELGYPARSDDLAPEVFLRPFEVIVTSTFMTSRSAARVMGEHGGGAVVTLSASLTGGTFAHMAALTAACGAIEAMTRALSGEYGPRGVRVNCVRADAMPETPTIQATAAGQALLGGVDAEPDVDPAAVAPPGPLGRPITVAETAATVAFLLSESATGIASQVVTVSGNAMAGG